MTSDLAEAPAIPANVDCDPDCAPVSGVTALERGAAEEYASWFSTLSDPTRVRLLHAVATAPKGYLRVGDLALELGISQPTTTHHVQKLEEVGFLRVDAVGTASRSA